MKKTRAGFVAIIGSPNAGKSTLLNKLTGAKISIVSPKPQTTRMRITGVLTEGDAQIGFIDTPGIFSPKRTLDRAMVEAAWGALSGADAIVLLIDAARADEKLDALIDELKARKKRVVVALNKIDKIPKAKLLPLAAQLNESGIAEEIFMVSALTGDGIADLLKHLAQKMPPGPWLFDEDQLTDRPMQLIAAELTREQLYRQLQQELPYAAAVMPESWEEKRDKSVVIRQTILIARPSHKPIVLGKGGARIKSIGEAARKEIAAFLGRRVHLFLDVKVDEKWQERREIYEMMGLEKSE